MKYLSNIIQEITEWCHASIDAPTELILTAGCPVSVYIQLDWTINSSNEDGFIIQRSTDGINWSQIDTVGAGVNTYQDTTIDYGIIYYYRVVAFGETKESNFSNVASDVCQLFGALYNWWSAIGIDPIITPATGFGNLYNWWAVTNAKNIANTGWHVPTSAETQTLLTSIGVPYNGKLREVGTTYWFAPNTGATNAFGFNGRGTGLRNGTTGAFSEQKDSFRFHTTDNYSVGYHTYGLYLTYQNTFEGLWGGWDAAYKPFGYECRLVKDSTSLTPGQTGTYIGNDGKVYRTICIGTQEWLADNLVETLYRDLTSIPEVTDDTEWAALTTDAMCYYDNDINNALIDSDLIPEVTDNGDWAALVTGAMCYYNNDPNNV
jgi:uncharacterized protein (TIGR02145 family)